MKGIFIPEITVEMFRNGCLEAIEELMADGEIYDIEYDTKSAEPEQKCESCRYHNLEWDDEPCDSCTMGGEGCHYKPERKKGKWIWQIENRYVCSECGHHTQVDELFEEPMYAFCPYCSTSMLDEDGNVRYER